MTNEQNHRNNKSVIANAFARAKAEHFEKVTDKMLALFEDLVTKDYVRLHRERNIGRHFEVPDSWGWSLFYDGALVKMWTNGGATIEGIDDYDKIEDVLSKPTSSKGWSGMFAASLEPVRYFKYDHENDIFNEIIPDVGIEVSGWFKPKHSKR